MQIRELICQPSQPRLNRIVHIFALILFLLAGILFCYHLYEAICFTLSFPNGSTLEGSIWMIHVSLLFLFLWMPAIIFLIKCWMTNKVAVGIYIAGCVFAVILSIVSIVIMNDYLQPGTVRDEYQKLVTKSIEENNRLPKAALYTVDSQKCCGWTGAIEYGVSFNISKKVKTDLKFMKELEQCYGKTWTVRKVNGKLEYLDGEKSLEAIPKGCNVFYKTLFHRNCLLVFYFGLLVIIFGLVFIVLCILLYKSSNKFAGIVSASPQENEVSANTKVTPDEDAVGLDNEPEDPLKSRKSIKSISQI